MLWAASDPWEGAGGVQAVQPLAPACFALAAARRAPAGNLGHPSTICASKIIANEIRKVLAQRLNI